MKRISYLAVAAALAGLAVTAPAMAQKGDKAAASTAPKLSKPVAALLSKAQTAQGAGDHAGALALVNEALALPKATAEDRYVSYQLMLASAQATKNNQLLQQAVDGALATGKVPPETEVKFRAALRALALQNKNYPAAIQQAQRLAQLSPNDPKLQFELAQVHQLAGQPREAYAAAMKAIEVGKAAGQVPEDYYRTAAKLALDNNMPAEFGSASAAWLGGYPSPENWRTVLSLFLDSAKFDDHGNLDVYRLMHATGSLGSEKDYYEYAETANRRGFPAEAKMIIDEGLAKGKLSTAKPYTKELRALVAPKVASDKASLPGLEADAKKAANGKLALSTGDAYLGHGNYAKAAELYRLALQKGGVDAATVNTRLGIALGKAGQKAEAQAALSAVQGGPRQQLAQYWLIWLNRQA
jgi:Flp pilus assembly protein TadD